MGKIARTFLPLVVVLLVTVTAVLAIKASPLNARITTPTTTPTPTLPEGASAFFLPKGHTTPSTANINVPYDEWAPGNCYYGFGVTNPFNGKWVSILGGWSNGRLGPIYYLWVYAHTPQMLHIHYILLIDPGNATDFAQSCENSQVGHVAVSPTLASWLALNKDNHLMIMAASATASDAGNGLTNYYLKSIPQTILRDQVTICWDDHLSHEEAFNKYAVNLQTSLISHPSNSCPAAPPNNTTSPTPTQAPPAAPTPTTRPAPTPTPIPPTAPTATPTPVTGQTTYAEQEGHYGANTFTNPYNASGMGTKIPAGAWVQVVCKVYAPQIQSANPDGYWYLIASSPWNSAYYAVANTFMNGDPWGGPYTHNTDFNVPDC